MIPVALLPNLPDPITHDLALTKVVLTRELSERVEVFLGKLDTLEYDTNAFADGNGRDRFFSTPFNYSPVATKTVPFSTLGAGFNIMNDDERLITFLVINTEDTPTTIGINELFAKGVALLAELRLPIEAFGRRGHQMIGGSWSSREFASLRQTGRVEFPNIPIAAKEGSWSLFWNFDHFVCQDSCDSSRGWGVFSQQGANPNCRAFFAVSGSAILARIFPRTQFVAQSSCTGRPQERENHYEQIDDRNPSSPAAFP